MGLLVLAGAGLVALVWLDVARTVLIPSTRGPLSQWIYRAVWRLPRAVPRRIRPRATQFAGPAAIAANMGTWVVLLWLGFALVYWPLLDRFSFSPDVRFADRGVVEALYLSGTTLTTLGFGDIVGEDALTRMLTILQAASGLALFTAAISFLPAIYTLVTALRASALSASDLGAGSPEGAAGLAVHGGVSAADTVRRDMIEAREHLLRFPVLFYFHPPVEESPLALARAGTGLVVALRWGVDPGAVAHAARWGAMLEAALHRLLDELARDVDAPAEPSAAPDAEARVRAVRDAVAAMDPDLAQGGPVPPDAARLLARADAVLGTVARRHGYPEDPPLGRRG